MTTETNPTTTPPVLEGMPPSPEERAAVEAVARQIMWHVYKDPDPEWIANDVYAASEAIVRDKSGVVAATTPAPAPPGGSATITDDRIHMVAEIVNALSTLDISGDERVPEVQRRVYEALGITVEYVRGNSPELYEGIGSRIRERRIALGQTQAYLAGQVELQRSSIVNAEAGRQRLPLHTLIQVAHALGVDPVDLIFPEEGHRALELRSLTPEQADAVRRSIERNRPTYDALKEID